MTLAERGGSSRRRTAAGVLALTLIVVAVPRAPEAGEAARPDAAGAAGPAPSARAPRLLPASSAMPLGAWRLPPPGYVDYCLRFKGRDQGCLT